MPVAAVGVVVVVFVSSKRDAETPLAHSPSAPFCLARAKRAPDLHPLALPLPFWLSLARVMPAHIAAMSPTDHAQDPSRPHVRPPPPAACSPKPTEDGRATWAAVGCCAPPSSPGLLPRPALPPSLPLLPPPAPQAFGYCSPRIEHACLTCAGPRRIGSLPLAARLCIPAAAASTAGRPRGREARRCGVRLPLPGRRVRPQSCSV